LNRFHNFGTAAGAIILTLAAVIPASPAKADGIRSQQWYLKALKITEAQAITKGYGIVVAVVDSGTYPHPDLQRNLLKGQNVITGQSGNGQSDRVGHGTHMAGLIAAHGRASGSGLLGIAPSAKVLPVKVTNSGIVGSATDLGRGIEWAAQNGAKVINVSAGGAPAFKLQEAVKAALSSDVVIVAGVGNTPTNEFIDYPAAIDGVLTVGASGRSGKYDPLSLKDPKVDLCAPGVDTITAGPKNKYTVISGTSSATAIVSGAAALVRSKFPQLSGEDVVHRLTATADDIGPPGRDEECGFGELNIVKALTADVPSVDGGATSSTSPTTTAAAPIPSAEPTAASPTQPAEKFHMGAVVGGIVGAIAVGALIGFFVLRRRRQT
jgi:type VII secretion-associated serine protease mycosin